METGPLSGAIRKLPFIGTTVREEHVYYAAGQLYLFAATFVFNLVAARALGPESIGVWQTANLIAVYGVFIALGLTNGMAREIPYHVGRKNNARVSEVVATSLRGVLVIAGTLWLSAVLVAHFGSADSVALWLGLALLGARILNGTSAMMLRSFQNFARLGAHQAISAILFTLAMAWIVWRPTLPALLAAVCLALVSVTVLTVPYLRVSPFSFARYKQLVGIGLPMLLAGLVFGLLTTVDRILILAFLDTAHLGLYTPAISVFGSLLILPSVVSNVMYPRLSLRYGETNSVAALFPSVRKMLKLNIAVTWSVAAIMGAVFYVLIVPKLLPAYMEGRAAVLIVVLSALFLPFGQSFGDLFNVIGWQRYYLRNMVIGFFVNAAVGYLLVGPMQLGLVGVAWGTVSGVGIYALFQQLTFRLAVRRHA